MTLSLPGLVRDVKFPTTIPFFSDFVFPVNNKAPKNPACRSRKLLQLTVHKPPKVSLSTNITVLQKSN